jgi:hypothetical protein
MAYIDLSDASDLGGGLYPLASRESPLLVSVGGLQVGLEAIGPPQTDLSQSMVNYL